MAYTTSHHTAAAPAAGSISRAFDRVLTWLANISENNPKLRQVRALQALSDEQLAARGLKRDEIVHHVFADQMHL